MRRLLVTGGMGFIGSNFVRYWRERHPEDIVVNLDLLTYAGNLRNLAELEEGPHYRFVCGDIADTDLIAKVMAEAQIDTVVHFAAESHVDRSIEDPQSFVRTNVLGTQVLLEAARRHGGTRFIQISTDEVYGTLGPEGLFTETTPLAPNSPYSASKAGADLLARAYFETYGFPVIVTRCSNNYGPFQFPEKLIPTLITRALRDEPLPIYGDGLNVRDWLHVYDHCSAVERVIEAGVPGEIYNIGGSNEKTNLELVHRILQELGKPTSLIRFVPDRLGHDRRYAIDSSKIRSQLGWNPAYRFEDGIVQTVQWYVSHAEWWHSEGGR
ncbi:dTDP-glucose 4,6-dehydratase [Paenibacillus sp. MZ04-78.2]|uniref:dTDP-glucose 4,6-dehydratase n=1 Tax=Paenibacillus sp. MZ04-78.2 TaxID=2962034 RepID=UPI0020B8919B|nr:dTDP-glucose 4,6-dehydratase [Paenibacillus sp. MZ04-78.2]MCP3776382.1 dTDP-glucose 4,6-dehydratase [Paenibacillus sp. MZ04-78.2]